jgi:hypothetical protein
MDLVDTEHVRAVALSAAAQCYGDRLIPVTGKEVGLERRVLVSGQS